MLNNYGYKHTLRMCNNYCLPKATMVTLIRLKLHYSTLLLLFMYYLLLPGYRNVKKKIHNITILTVPLPLQSLGLHHSGEKRQGIAMRIRAGKSGVTKQTEKWRIWSIIMETPDRNGRDKSLRPWEIQTIHAKLNYKPWKEETAWNI